MFSIILFPIKLFICNDKDPPWMTNEIKQCCLNKAKIYTRYIKNGRSFIGQQDLQNASNYSTNLIKEVKKIIFVPLEIS